MPRREKEKRERNDGRWRMSDVVLFMSGLIARRRDDPISLL